MDCAAIMVNGLEEKIAIVGIYRRPGVRLQRGRIKNIIKEVKESSVEKRVERISRFY